MKPKFFETPADFRTWLESHHARATELWVGFYRKDSGRQNITWPESVDQALCFGWIDGIRKSVDEISYQIRFTPRRRGSIWSAINIKRARELVRQKQMRPTGLKAFAARLENKSGIYSYEQRSTNLKQPYAKLLEKNKAAANFFNKQPPSYRKMIGWWIVSAKKEETRMARLRKLISESANGKRLLQ
ncbi:MAG TPA: YdeI/OmpD-associated family protein [Candidatus Udaeobacter sp.]|nr:YdeI/OmpD-associated family protein [Candidatus Udaeobacter sp.]